MKRKIKISAKIIPVLALTILMVACGKGDDHKSFDTVKLLQSGSYFYEGKFYDGSDLDGYTIKMAVLGADFVIAFYDHVGTELGRSVKVDGKGYYVDTAAKKYSRDNYYDDVTFTYSGMTFIDSGTSKIKALDGVEDTALYYEDYEATYGTEVGNLRFYYKNDKLYAIQEDFTDASDVDISEVVVIKKISSETPTDLFGIPKDYKESK